MRSLSAGAESWPLLETFTISRGSKDAAVVVVAEISDGEDIGRGECVPYERYGEDIASVLAQIEALRAQIENGLSRRELQSVLPAGSARNALDCALWDLEARQAGIAVWQTIGIPVPTDVVTAYTLSMAAPAEMAMAARRNAHRPLLKIKLGTSGIRESVSAIRDAAPEPGLIIDANESWNADLLEEVFPFLASAGVVLIEQPLSSDCDSALDEIDRLVPVAADESCHTSADVPRLRPLYDVVNIKLDKTGGLTEALSLKQAASVAGLGIMVGCMVSTSLAMAPAMMLAGDADFVDLDGPLLLREDRLNGLSMVDERLQAPPIGFWGSPPLSQKKTTQEKPSDQL